MKIAKLISYIGLGLVAALIICVIILACVPAKIMPTFEKPNQIIVHDCANGSDYYVVNKDSSDKDQQATYNKLYDTFNAAGTYSVLSTIFSGVSGSSYQVKYVGGGSGESKTVSQLKSDETLNYDYVIEFTFETPLVVTDAAGVEYSSKNNSNANSTNVKVASIAIGVSKNAGAQETYIYAYSESNTNYWVYASFMNTSSLYNICNSIEGYHA